MKQIVIYYFNVTEAPKFQVNGSEINAISFYLGNISKYFSIDNTKKVLWALWISL